MKIKLILLVLIFGLIQNSRSEIIPYKAPLGSVLNSDFSIKVREKGRAWQALPSYLAQVAKVGDHNAVVSTENTSFSYFDFNGEVEIAITFNKGTVKSSRVRPLSSGIIAKSSNNTITFSLNKPSNLSIEVNGDIFHNLQLFAGAIQSEKPIASDTSVIYFGPGIHQVGTLAIPSNKTVYIAGGAIVRGRLLVSHAENVRIIGRGILTQMPIDSTVNGMVVNPVPANALKNSSVQGSRNDILTVEYSKNVEVNGITVLPHKYSIMIGQSNNIKLQNFKSFSSEGNADGIDVFCSSNIAVDRIYMRNADDCIAIYGHRWKYYGNTSNITVKNAVLWADVAHPILIGTHGDTVNPDTLSNISMNTIDILDQHENQVDYQGCISLNAGDSNLIRNVTFTDVNVEDVRKGQLVNMRVMYNKKYNTSAGQGIRDVYFKNLSYNGKNANMSVIVGYDENRGIKKVTFENLRINGKFITDDMDGKPSFYKTSDMSNFFVGEHVEDLKFIKTVDTFKKAGL